jgi:hypothetical protein
MFKLSKLALIGALSVAFVSCGSVAHAADPHKEAFISVEQLLKWYSSPHEADNDKAYVFIAGVHDSVTTLQICTPRGMRLDELSAIMAKALVHGVRNNEDMWDMNAGYVLNFVMKMTYPCQPKGKNV